MTLLMILYANEVYIPKYNEVHFEYVPVNEDVTNDDVPSKNKKFAKN